MYIKYLYTSFFLCVFTGSGKTTFLKQLLASYNKQKKVYLFGQDLEEYANTGVTLLKEDPLEKDFDNAKLEKNSLLIIEDFIPKGKKETSNLHFLLNYFSRHNKVDIFIVVHQLFFNQISFFLSTARELYISVAPSNLILTKRLDKLYALGLTRLFTEALRNQEHYNFVALFDCAYFIYPFNQLFLNDSSKKIMFFNNNKKYYLLDSEKFDFKQDKKKQEADEEGPLEKLKNLVKSVYPKKSTNILLLAKELYIKLENLHAVNKEFIVIVKKKQICHLMDLISAIQAPGNQCKLPDNIVHVLKFLQHNRMFLMSKLVANKTAKKYLCIGGGKQSEDSE